MTERNGAWMRIFAIAGPLAAAALIAWGTLRSDVTANAEAIERKADKETVQVQYDAIIRELGAIRGDLSDLKAHR